MRFLLVFLLCISCSSACSELFLDIELPAGTEPQLVWSADPELFYAQMQVVITSGETFVSLHLIDSQSLLLGELLPGDYTATLSYLYPSCNEIATANFLIEPAPDLHYQSSSQSLFEYGLFLLLGTVIAFCIILVLRR